MILLQSLQTVFIALDGGLQLTDVFGATLPKSSLSLPIALLTFFRSGIDLVQDVKKEEKENKRIKWEKETERERGRTGVHMYKMCIMEKNKKHQRWSAGPRI